MTELSPEARKLLSKGRTAFSPNPERLDAVHDALLARIAASASIGQPSGAAGAQGSELASAAARSAWVGSTAAKIRLATIVTISVATGYFVGYPPQQAPTPAQTQPAARDADGPKSSAAAEIPAAERDREEVLVPERARDDRLAGATAGRNKRTSARATRQGPTASGRVPSALVPPLPETPTPTRAAVSAPAQSLAPVRASSPPVDASHPPGPPPVQVSLDTLAREAALVRDARAAAKRGDHELALEILARHEQSFPNGVLREERFAIRARALCALGRTAAARADIRRLAELAPGSPHLHQLEQVCASSSDSAPGSATE